MPQVVNIPNVGRVNFPDGMTPEAIAEAIERDILPQYSGGATPFQSAEARVRSRENALKQEPVEGPGGWARFGRGMLDIGQGLNQKWLQLNEAAGNTGGSSMIDPKTGQPRRPLTEQEQQIVAGMKPAETAEQLTGRVNNELDLYNKGRATQLAEHNHERISRGEEPKKSELDLQRIAGNIAVTLPLAAVGPGGSTILARGAAGGLQGALAGGAQFTPSGEVSDTATNAAVGGAVGAVAAPVVGAISDKALKLVQKLVGAWRGMGANTNVDDILTSIPEFKELPEVAQRDLIAEAQRQIRTSGTLSAEELARKANLITQGVKPTRSMVTRNPGDWTMERNLQKLAGSADDELRQTGQQLTDVYTGNDKALTTALQKLSANLPKGTQEAHGMTAMKALDALAESSQDDVSNLYTAVRTAKGDQLASDARQLASTLDDLRDNTYAEKLVGSVTNKLRRFGMLDAEGNLTDKTLTVTQAEELRKFVNKLPNDFGKKDIVRAIDADVLSGLGEDAFSGARKAAQERFAMLGNPSTQRALNALGELQQGKTAQNFIKSQVIDAADQDVETLMKTLGNLPSAKQAEAVDALRAGVLSYLEDAAGNPNSAKFSGAAFNKAIDDIGEKKLAAVLGMPQYVKLKNLARAALDATYEPPYSAVNHSGSGTTLLSFLQRARTVPGVPLLVTDNAEKLAAQAAYRRQLAEALAARSRAQLPAISPKAIATADALRAGAAVTPIAAASQKRKK
jgi:hypothetical protein